MADAQGRRSTAEELIETAGSALRLAQECHDEADQLRRWRSDALRLALQYQEEIARLTGELDCAQEQIAHLHAAVIEAEYDLAHEEGLHMAWRRMSDRLAIENRDLWRGVTATYEAEIDRLRANAAEHQAEGCRLMADANREIERLREQVALLSAARDGHPGMCCGQCADEIERRSKALTRLMDTLPAAFKAYSGYFKRTADKRSMEAFNAAMAHAEEVARGRA